MKLVVLIYRIGNWFYRIGWKSFSKLFSYLNRFLFSCWLPSSASIGSNFTIGYGGLGVVIHSNAVIGENVTIGQNVTIGRNMGDKRVPEIGNDVYIGAGSVVFGEIVIGNNVIIGANSVVNRSIPDSCTVVGNPGKIIADSRELTYYEIDSNGGK